MGLQTVSSSGVGKKVDRVEEILTDNSTIEFDPTVCLRLNDLGIVTGKIANSAVTASKLSVGAVLLIDHSDATEDTQQGSSYTTKKTRTIVGGTFDSFFLVFATGWAQIEINTTSTADARITIGGTQKIDVNILNQESGAIAGNKTHGWSLFLHVPSSYYDGTAASDVDVDIDLRENADIGGLILVNQLLIWGR